MLSKTVLLYQQVSGLSFMWYKHSPYKQPYLEPSATLGTCILKLQQNQGV